MSLGHHLSELAKQPTIQTLVHTIGQDSGRRWGEIRAELGSSGQSPEDLNLALETVMRAGFVVSADRGDQIANGRPSKVEGNDELRLRVVENYAREIPIPNLDPI